MSTSITFPMLGLALDQPPSMAPKGAMSQADNVVGDLPGMLRGRPNNAVIYSEDAMDPDDYGRPDTLIRIGENWVAHQGGATPLWRNAAGAIAGFTEGSPYFGAPAQYAMSRGSTYIGTSEGVAKLESGTSQVMLDAGVEMSLAPFASNLPRVVQTGSVPEPPPGPFTSPFTVGYRLVIKRTDASGYIARSAPSSIFSVFSPGISTYTDVAIVLLGDAVTRRWYFPAGTVREGDVVEFYRSRIVTTSNDGPLAPDYYLVTTYEVSAADVTGGFFPSSGSGLHVYDTLPDGQLAEALYTNPARGGALAAKFPPPIASALALWSGAMWYGNVTERARAAYKLASVGGGTPANRASDGESFGVTTDAAAAIVNGTPGITVASVAGIRVGMYVTSATSGPQTAGDFPPLTQVLSIAGAGPYVVTATANALGATGVTTLYFGDYIDIDGERFYAALISSTSADRGFGVSDSPDASMRAADTTNQMMRVVNSWMAVNGGDVRVLGGTPVVAAAVGGDAGGFVVEAVEPDGTFTVGGTSAPDAFVPSLYKPTAPQDTAAQGRLYWSDPDEPEAVRLLSSVVVGNLRSRILSLTPLRDALLVWKEDGLFRVTGAGPDRWSVDLIDPTLVLERPGAVDVMRGTAYAVTNRGFVAVNEGGVAGVPAHGKVETLFRAPTLPLVVTWERLGLVLIADAVAVQEGSPPNTVYCYAVATGVWARWPSMWLSAWGSAGSTDSPLMAATRPDLDPLFEIREFSEGEGRGYDNVWGPVPYTVVDGEVVVAEADRGDWYPAVGDWLGFGFAVFRRVIDVVIDGTDWVLTLDVAAVDGGGDPVAMYAYEGAPVQIEIMPSASGSGAPFSLPVWREVSISFSNGPADEKGSTPARLTFGVRDDFTLSTLLAEVQRSTVSLRPYRIGWPRNASRRAVVWPRLGFSEIDWPWRLAGISLVGEGGSEKVRR